MVAFRFHRHNGGPAWNPNLENDLRDATCISRIWTTLAEVLRESGQAEEAARLEAQRAELWKYWEGKLPNGEFSALLISAAGFS